MGFSAKENIDARPLFSTFRARGNKHPDGWGCAFYTDKSATVFKEAGNAVESKLAYFLEKYPLLNTKLFIAHIRKASVGGQAHQNTHPFLREMNGKEYVLAHNGTLKNFREKLLLGRIKPLGVNDSEFLLCYLLGQIEKKAIKKWDKKSFEWLNNELQEINNTGKLNCIFSDGKLLFAYYDKNDYNSLYHFESGEGVIIATKPLTKNKWEKFKKGQLIVIKNGKILFY